ncbi:AAA family ATPase [Dactylosporangium sp. NPDC005572]|uniref:AAA family ATPase n=1 Tax=Dactylosporangium sp. NPDC005572 TaxID=3156889 RepID=UPI0033AC6B35
MSPEQWLSAGHQLAGALDDAVSGRGGVVLVSGPVGAGKTELLRRLAAQARDRGARVVRVVASRSGRTAPLGIVRQLLAAAGAAPAGDPARAAHQDIMAALSADRPGAPLVVSVDDVHHADAESLAFLSYLARRIRHPPVLVVLTESVSERLLSPQFRAELLSQPHTRQLRLGLLSRDAAAAVLRERLGDPVADRVVDAYLEASGGNPRLLAALVEDRDAADGPAPGLVPGPVAGAAFGDAVLLCLHRSTASLVKLARALAVLDETTPPAVLAELLNQDLWSTIRATNAATEAGLIEAGRFRHPRAREAVLDGMLPEERLGLHRRAADVLHRADASVVAVARQLVAARPGPDDDGRDWIVPVLLDAAGRALDTDELGFALDCLAVADACCTGDEQRAAVRALQVGAQWRLDPQRSRPWLPELVAAARRGLLDGTAVLRLVSALMWFGAVDDALELLDRVPAEPGQGEFGTVMARYSSAAQLFYLFPGAVSRCTGPGAPDAARETYRQAAAIVEYLTGPPSEQQLAMAERILRQSKLGTDSLGPIWISVEVLLRAEHTDRAAYWCDALLAETEHRRLPVWSALFGVIRAMISYRQGELDDAAGHTRRAMALLPPPGWGVMVGLPLSLLVRLAVHEGALDEAAGHLRVPVPDLMFDTPAGLFYRRARGYYHLARGDQRAAAADFDACRSLCLAWDRDVPGFLPWRLDAAQLHLAAQQPERARQLALEQLELLGEHNQRTRGMTLRVLAAASEPAERPAILKDAVEALRAGDDRHELADALAHLVQALREVGEHNQARLTLRMSSRLAGADRADPGAVPRPLDGLSEAELRVATLVAQGLTNREIAGRLSITVSTVEQHLTRIYKKLGVRGRSGLSVALERDTA